MRRHTTHHRRGPQVRWLTRGSGRIVLAALAGVFVSVGILWLLPGDPAAAESHLQGDVFDFGITVPDEPLTVGDTIEFTNSGARPHTVTDRGNTFDTNGIQPGGSASVTFDVPGTYEIFCRINPGSMNATVEVEPGDDPPDEVRIQTFDPNFDPDPERATLRFDPPELQVQPGTQITVANVGGAPHTLTADDGSFDTGEIAPGAEQGRFAGDHATFVAEEQGVFDFRCLIHPEEMQGTLIVAGDPVDEPEPEPPDPEPEPEPEEIADPGAGAVDAVEVAMEDFSFVPFEVAALPGAELTWTNRGNAPHTATFDEVEGRVEGLDTGSVSSGDTGVLTAPDAPGTYSYFCALHPSMRGVLVVAADRGPPDEGAGAEPDVAEADPADGEVDADPVDDTADEAVAAPAEGDFSTPALVGAIAILIAGAGAIVIALRGPRPEQAGENGGE